MQKINEKYIQSVLEIERQAQAIQEEAQREAEQLPIQAEDEAEDLLQQARAEAEERAHHLVEGAQSKEERARILAEAEESIQLLKTQTMSHFDRAVDYVLDMVAGKE
jgi:V/A-type H+-transporting ATPase subunit G/H